MLPIKKFIFLLLRLGKEVALYESIHQNINRALRVLHIGNEVRGREFIKRLYGRLPERRVLDKQFTRTGLEYLKSREIECDLILVEINRLYERRFREEGFFTLPEWIEFGREVVKNGDSRYAGAKKSLKSDLKKIRSADFDVVITKDNDDFYLFYDKMYLPYLSKRFGNTIIKKSRKKVMKDFRSGFLLQLKHDRQPVAGAIVRIDGDVVIQTTLGVLDGSDELLKMGVSGAIDYYLHEWAANNSKRFINVGHTRPFPLDGIFINKRKWLMSVVPDYDGVMDMAVKICRHDDGIINILRDYPFVFQSRSGLGIFCTHAGTERAGIREIRLLLGQFRTDGIRDLVIVSPAGYSEGTIEGTRELFGDSIHLFTDVNQALELQKAAFDVI